MSRSILHSGVWGGGQGGSASDPGRDRIRGRRGMRRARRMRRTLNPPGEWRVEGRGARLGDVPPFRNSSMSRSILHFGGWGSPERGSASRFMTGAGVQSTWAGAQRNARRRPLTTLDYTAWAQRRGGLPAVHLTRDRQCREGGSNSHEVLPSTDFKCFTPNGNSLNCLAFPPTAWRNCVSLCVSFRQNGRP